MGGADGFFRSIPIASCRRGEDRRDHSRTAIDVATARKRTDGGWEKIESYLAGLKHARGSVIILTEGHVAAEPTCIEAVFGHFEANPESAGCFFRWLHDNQTEVARMEEAF